MSRPMRTVRRTLMSAALALLAAGAAVPAHAQAYPTKPIKIVVGFPAGSATDVIARVVAEHLRAKLGQPVIVENRPGANAVLGVDLDYNTVGPNGRCCWLRIVRRA